MAESATTHERQAHYYVPQPMPWPIMGSTALFCMALGATLIFNSMTGGWVSLALLADLRSQSGGKGNRGGVGASASQRGNVLFGGHALKSGHQDDLALFEGLSYAARSDVEDLGLGMRCIGDDTRLGSGERYRVIALIVDGHGQEGRGYPLAGGQEHVHLAGGRIVGDLLRHLDELVGGVPASGDHGYDRVPRFARLHNTSGHPLDAGGIGHRAASEFHDHDVGAVGLPLRSADDDVLLTCGIYPRGL